MDEVMGGLWAAAYIGGPILLGLGLAVGLFLRRRRRLRKGGVERTAMEAGASNAGERTPAQARARDRARSDRERKRGAA